MGRVEFWFYASISQIAASALQKEIADIVEVSTRRNRSLRVSGALIATGHRFAQYLEGPSGELAILRESITADPRHRDVWTVDAGFTPRRNFADWALAYTGSTPYFEELVRQCREMHPSSARILLAEMTRLFPAA